MSQDDFVNPVSAAQIKLAASRQPRIDLEALRKALVDAAKNAQLPTHYQWSESNQSKFRFGAETAAAAVDALLAQLEGAKGQPKERSIEEAAAFVDAELGHLSVYAPKPEAQTCPNPTCSHGWDAGIDDGCGNCNGTGKVGGGK